jgi:hypothetical protein
MAPKQQRGSDKLSESLFSGEKVTRATVAKHLFGAAGVKYQLMRWWWKGQPAIDFLHSTVQIPRRDVGGLVGHLADLQNEQLQVTIEVFPFGTPKPDLAQINVTLQQNLKNL